MKYQTISLSLFFAVKGTIYYVTIKTVIVLMCEDNMFSRESSPGISLVSV